MSFFFLGVGPKTSNDAVRGEMGWTAQKHKQFVEILRLYCRLKKIGDDRSIAVMHKHWLISQNRGIWESKVKKLFAKLGLELPKEGFNTKNVIKEAQRYLNLYDQEEWYYKLMNDKHSPNGNKLRTYRLHKTRLQMEEYVCAIPRFQRSYLSKLRCGSAPLNIETGRFSNIPLDQRYCILCDSQAIENEIHFTIECPFYDDLRHEL